MKKLVLEVLTTKWGKLLRVKEQTHYGNEFGIKDYKFIASNGFDICSHTELCILKGLRLYVPEDINPYSDSPVFVYDDDLAKIRVAVREYNEYFSDKKPKAKPDGEVEVIE